MTAQPIAVDLATAAEMAGTSIDTIRRAIRANGRDAFPPPLTAKRMGRGANARQVIKVSDLHAWVDALPDS